MFIEKKVLQVGFKNDTYKVAVSFYGNPKSKRIIAFSQGYCYDSILYLDLFNGLLGKDCLIVAPEINGLRIKSTKGIFDNSNLENCRILFKKTIRKAIGRKRLFCVIGHSMGSNVCLSVESDRAILINPQMPLTENSLLFLSRGIPTLIKEMSAKKSGKFRLKVVFDYLKNFTSNISNNLIYINNLKKQRFEDILKKTDIKILLINSSKDGFDGFFRYDKTRFRKHYKNISIIDLPGTHSSILYKPKAFVQYMSKFLKS